MHYHHNLDAATETQLEALSTQRLNNYRKQLRQANAYRDPLNDEYYALDDPDSKEWKERYALVKRILATRAHLPSKREQQASRKKQKRKLKYQR